MGVWTKLFGVLVLSLVVCITTGCPRSKQPATPNSTSTKTPQANNAQANQIAESLDIPLDIAFPLLKLHKRFGDLDTNKLATSGLIVSLMSDDWHDYLRESIQITQAALDNSNAEHDLGAPPKPTGDRLFDLYAEAVFAQIEAIRWSDVTSDESMFAAALPDAVVAPWEHEFKDDPHYWELRYFCALYYPGNNPLAEGYKEPMDFLQHSREIGVATANTLLNLYTELIWETYENDDALPVLDEAIAKWPDECWPWYYRALDNFRAGNMEQALADLKHGNMGEYNVYPRPYPFSFVEKHFGGKSPSGSALISGAILMTAQPYRLPNTIQWKEFQQQSLDEITEPLGIELLNDWQSFACNLAQSDKIDFILPMVALVMVRNNLEFMKETQLVDLAETQYEVLWRESGANELFRDFIRESDSASVAVDGATALGMAGGVKGISIAWYLSAELDYSVLGRNSIISDDLRMIDYTTMEMPKEMLKYEALTPEDLEQRRVERRARIAKENAESN